MSSNVLEIPFTSATVLDSTLNAGGPNVSKYRQAFRQKLHPGLQISLGRPGTIHLNSIPLLHCVAVEKRWDSKSAERLRDAYDKAGLSKLQNSQPYKQALERTGACISFHKAKMPAQIFRCVTELSTTDPVVRKVAVDLGEILHKVDVQLSELRRMPGRVVRFEGPRALVVVNTGEREELRSVDSDFLQLFGLQDQGDPFLLHQFECSPDTTMSLYIPAMDLTEDSAAGQELEKRLNDAITPLPQPPDIPV